MYGNEVVFLGDEETYFVLGVVSLLELCISVGCYLILESFVNIQEFLELNLRVVRCTFVGGGLGIPGIFY